MSNYEKITTGMGEECGVFGAYDMDGGDVAPSVYYGLFALQHRGQESCGIAVTDTYGERKVHSKKGLGLVNEVFTREKLDTLPGQMAVGHCRYATTGAKRVMPRACPGRSGANRWMIAEASIRCEPHLPRQRMSAKNVMLMSR